MKKDILIIGGAGYIGGVLIRKLLSAGFSVKVLDALIYNNGSVLLPWINHPDFKFIKGDLRDKSVLRQALQGVSDVILLAALVGDPISKSTPN